MVFGALGLPHLDNMSVKRQTRAVLEFSPRDSERGGRVVPLGEQRMGPEIGKLERGGEGNQAQTKLTREEKRERIERVRRDSSLDTIAKQAKALGITESSYFRWCKATGIEGEQSERKRKAVIENYGKGGTLEEQAKRAGSKELTDYLCQLMRAGITPEPKSALEYEQVREAQRKFHGNPPKIDQRYLLDNPTLARGKVRLLGELLVEMELNEKEETAPFVIPDDKALTLDDKTRDEKIAYLVSKHLLKHTKEAGGYAPTKAGHKAVSIYRKILSGLDAQTRPYVDLMGRMLLALNDGEKNLFAMATEAGVLARLSYKIVAHLRANDLVERMDQEVGVPPNERVYLLTEKGKTMRKDFVDLKVVLGLKETTSQAEEAQPVLAGIKR